jgi:hypothetical protein
VPWPMSGRARRDRLAHAHRDPPAMLDDFGYLINEVAMRDFESSLYEMRVEHTVVFVDLGAQEEGHTTWEDPPAQAGAAAVPITPPSLHNYASIPASGPRSQPRTRRRPALYAVVLVPTRGQFQGGRVELPGHRRLPRSASRDLRQIHR